VLKGFDFHPRWDYFKPSSFGSDGHTKIEVFCEKDISAEPKEGSELRKECCGDVACKAAISRADLSGCITFGS
jgi:hypothetical protein